MSPKYGTWCAAASILGAATPAQSDKPAKTTTIVYRDVLSQLWLLDQVEPWALHRNDFARLAQAPKHFLADPALAVRLLGLDEEQLMAGAQVRHLGPQQGTLMGRLFEALVALSLKTYAQASELTVSHLRTIRGEHEIDFIIHGGGRTCVGIEVKLASSVTDSDVKHLLWLKETLGDELREMAVIYTGASAYRRRDGVAVIPAALLGP